MARQVIYELHTTWLLFEMVYTRNRYAMLLGWLTDAPPEAVGIAPRTDPVLSPPRLLAELALRYDGAARFADEELGVSLETWLAIHPVGPQVAMTVADVLDRHAGLLSYAETELLPDLTKTDDEAGTDVSVDELAERWYRELQNVWADAVGGRRTG